MPLPQLLGEEPAFWFALREWRERGAGEDMARSTPVEDLHVGKDQDPNRPRHRSRRGHAPLSVHGPLPVRRLSMMPSPSTGAGRQDRSAAARPKSGKPIAIASYP